MIAWDVVLVLAGMACWITAGLSALSSVRGASWHPALGWLGSLSGLAGTVWALMGDGSGVVTVPWMQGWQASVAVDHLSAFFLVPVFLGGGLAATYTHGYAADLPAGRARHLRVFLALLVAAMALVVTARQGVLFLLAWEVMALAAYFLITTEDQERSVRQAGWVYLITTHAGTLALIAMVVLLALRTGSLEWLPASGGRQAIDTAITALAMIGFGCKAGLLPTHFWLPAAHAAAPSPASALLSGVMLKTGVYGILRISGLLPAPPAWLGGVLLVLGCGTALYGILHALNQADYKRLLAYSSIENLGIIAIGIGLAWTGRACGSPALIALGLGGALLHVWNHFLFKTLLFHGAGTVLHATGTRSIDRLGGLAKDMPVTAGCTLVGCLAVAALPPFNGFIGEWLLYRALFGAIHEQPWLAALAIPALAFTGALAAAAFVKTFGMIFLGEPRDPTIPAAHDPPPTMRGAMMATAVACAVLGIATVAVLPVLDQVVAAWSSAGGAPPLGTLVGHDLLIMGMACAALTGVMAVAWRFLGRRLPATAVRRTGTWDCGYAAPTARMQYTGRSLTAWLGDMIPGLRALVVVPRVRSLFPVRERFSATTPDALGDRIYAPRLQRAAERIMRLRWLQQGLLHMYLLYVLIGLVILFTWMLIRTGIAG